jgi:hypothetical protein
LTSPSPHVLIGLPRGDHVGIHFLRRLYPWANDYWDANWLEAEIEVSLGRFRAKIDANLRSNEIAAFRKSLEHLKDSLSGEALLESIEEWITVRVVVVHVGQLRVTGAVADAAGGRNGRAFSIDDLDESHLLPILDSLRNIETKFPVVGLR